MPFAGESFSRQLPSMRRTSAATRLQPGSSFTIDARMPAKSVALEQLRDGQHLVTNYAKSPEVGLLVYGFAALPLRRTIGGGAEDHAGFGGFHGEGGLVFR